MAVNMKEQLNITDLHWMDTEFSRDDSKLLLEDNHKEMNKSIQKMQRLIEEEDECLQNKSELNLYFTSFCNNYQLLAERYEKLVGRMQQIGSLMPISSESDSRPDQGTPKLGLHKLGNQTASPSSGGGSSDMSVKEGTDSFSVSSDSDSESASFCSTNVYFKSPMGTDIAATPKKDDLELPQERETDCASKVRGKRAYGALEQRLLNCEEELKLCNLKLQLSEEEVARLKSELENCDFQLEKGQVSDLQQEILELEAQIQDSIFENASLQEELNASKDRMKDSDEEIASLKHKLQLRNDVDFQAKLREAREELDIVRAELATEKTQVLDLQDRITSYCNGLSEREEVIGKLKNESSALQKEFSEETAKLKSDNVGLSNKQIELEARLIEWELRGKQVEDQLRQFEVEKADMRDAQNDLETGMQVQINQLKQEVAEKGRQIEALNKEHDKYKFKYDTLMAEKDEITAKMNSLFADLSSKDIQIAQIEERLRQSDGKHLQLVSESESAQKVVQDLRSRVLELETEVEVQRVMLMDRAEEKREAIRQLCFSLEHYRSGYEQLCQALSKHKHHAVVAS